ncbi:hypothetical protein HPB52_011363 [Rhipicephalus sanguineus]|uniref:Uncharacterized protein n=1 Tax=Rhipicephalus sanguineus TaxID=34632 RepID=A0A9D4PZP5_RHISA|nr:hypothetical protein HPB52_011363 [Rhipicephalus sanguineus]
MPAAPPLLCDTNCVRGVAEDAFLVFSVSPSSAASGPAITAGIVRTLCAVEVEEEAIALTATSADAGVILSDLLLQYYHLERCAYPPPHGSLPKRSEIAWRRLQTRISPCPLVLSYIHPGVINPRCYLCDGIAMGLLG